MLCAYHLLPQASALYSRRWIFLLWFVFCLSSSLLLLGCGDPVGPKACTKDSECAANQKCQSQVCVKKVVVDTCQSSADCGTSKICENGKCKQGGCTHNSTRPCYAGSKGTKGVGVCNAGTQTCKDGIWDVCVGEVLPQKESCNSKDDDCDGKIDEALGCGCNVDEKRECYSGPPDTKNKGICLAGTQYCSKDGKWGDCLRESLPYKEDCDGKDNDCNGKTDESFAGKGDPCPTGKFGACSQGIKACIGGKIVCDEINKAKKEICDQQDNDCDGQIDEDGVCANCDEGKERTCYTGPQGTVGKGICKSGKAKCVNGKWSPCLGESLPSAEKCGDSIDNNCNGQVDEICVECKQNEKRDCYKGTGGCVKLSEGKYTCFSPCKTGQKTCFGGRWGTCKGEVNPTKEACDGLDNDCDGSVDEGCNCKTGEKRFCYSGPPQTRGRGECKAGVQTCDSQGKWSACQGEVKPETERCDGKDNDCDGNTDGFSKLCYSGPPGSEKRGQCRTGAQACNNGKWSSCVGERKPKPEICDGLDNDCDGAIDGFSRPCFGGSKGCTSDGKGGYKCTGSCRSGFQQCASGRWSVCAGEVMAKQEICNNQDDDCDGTIDNFSETCYNAPDTGCTKKSQGVYKCQGECKVGKRSCAGGNWSICLGVTSATKETCNNQDDDCDGQIDNFQRKCWTGKSQNRNQGLCQDGLEQCTQGKWSTCQNEVLPKVEVCNGKDDDCDGSIDEELKAPPCKLQKGVCAQKVQLCGAAKGWLACTAKEYGSNYQPTETQCDGLDNDCDGKIDGSKACGTCFSTQIPAKYVSTLPSSCGTQQKCFEDCLYHQGKLYYCRNVNNKGYSYTTYQDWLNACSSTKACQTSQCASTSYFCTGASWRQGTKPGTNDDYCDNIDNNCNGTTDEGCICGSPCLADQHCPTSCRRCVKQPGKTVATCMP